MLECVWLLAPGDECQQAGVDEARQEAPLKPGAEVAHLLQLIVQPAVFYPGLIIRKHDRALQQLQQKLLLAGSLVDCAFEIHGLRVTVKKNPLFSTSQMDRAVVAMVNYAPVALASRTSACVKLLLSCRSFIPWQCHIFVCGRTLRT